MILIEVTHTIKNQKLNFFFTLYSFVVGPNIKTIFLKSDFEQMTITLSFRWIFFVLVCEKLEGISTSAAFAYISPDTSSALAERVKGEPVWINPILLVWIREREKKRKRPLKFQNILLNEFRERKELGFLSFPSGICSLSFWKKIHPLFSLSRFEMN